MQLIDPVLMNNVNTNTMMTAMMDNMLEMMLYFDRMGAVTYSNKMANVLLGYEDMVNVQISDVFPGVFEITRDGFQTEYAIDGSDIEVMAYRKNRTFFKIIARIFPNPFAANSYILVGADISKQAAMEKEITTIKENAADIDQVKNEFVANVTHELRTPVNGILGNTRELLTHGLGDEDTRILNMIERGCEDMNALINNILDFSKLEAGKFQLEPREFVFRNMIDYVKSNHINKIHEKGLDFFVTVSPDIPEKIIGDELRIVQILNNLLSNAAKFTTVGKVMMEAVPTAKTGNRMEIFFMVMDTGIGIDKKNQDKLFKSFSQVEASISRRFGGTGLGLNISKQLVELMGGHINVESEPGKGTTFTFSIWVDVPEDGSSSDGVAEYKTVAPVFTSASAESAIENTRVYGSKENIEEIRKRLTKLALCIDMETWDKAEMFMDAIKQLTDGAPREISTAVLKLKMAVQKENIEKANDAIDALNLQLGGE